MLDIDWLLLTRAKDFYAGRGYHYVETPWIVPVEACQMTFHSHVLMLMVVVWWGQVSRACFFWYHKTCSTWVRV